MTENGNIRVLKNRLGTLRRDLRLLTLLAGLATIVTTAVLACYASLAVDRLTDMDVAQRAVVLGLSLVLLAWIAVKHLVGPLKATLNEDALCLLVEKKNPDTGSRLISALQLDRMENLQMHGYSMAMVENAVNSGGSLAEAADFTAVLNTGYRNKRLLTCLVALSAFITTCIVFQSTMSIWFQRNVLFMKTAWPKNTQLTVIGLTNGVLRVAEDDDLTISVQAETVAGKRPPAEINVQFRYANGDRTEPQAVGTSGGQLFRTVVKGVNESFEFRVKGGDDDTDWLRVEVLPRPTLASFAIQATPPAYTGESTFDLPTGQSTYKVLAGTELRLRGTASQALDHVSVSDPTQTVGRILPLDGASSFDVDLGVPKQGIYKLMMINEDGISAKAPTEMRVRIIADAKPTVRMSAKGISDIVLPQAVLPLSLQAKDDYAILSSFLTVQVAGEEEGSEKTVETPLKKLVCKKEQVRIIHTYSLKPLAVTPGSHLMFKAVSTDNDTITGPKVGNSSTLVLRVVTEDEFRQALLRREQALRLDFDQILATQKELLEAVRILRATKKGDDRSLRKRQQRLNTRVLSLTRSFNEAYVEVMNNRLEPERGPTVTRLREGIIEPLGGLSATELTAAVNGLANDDLTAAQTAQAAALARMKAIRKSMVKSETFQEAAKLLRGIIERQKELKKETRKRAEEELDDVFE